MKNAMLDAHLMKKDLVCARLGVCARAHSTLNRFTLIQRMFELKGIQGLSKPICGQIRGQKPVF